MVGEMDAHPVDNSPIAPESNNIDVLLRITRLPSSPDIDYESQLEASEHERRQKPPVPGLASRVVIVIGYPTVETCKIRLIPPDVETGSLRGLAEYSVQKYICVSLAQFRTESPEFSVPGINLRE
jgi:hypothetical protein